MYRPTYTDIFCNLLQIIFSPYLLSTSFHFPIERSPKLHCFVYLLSFNLTTCPAHFHFNFLITLTRSRISACYHVFSHLTHSFLFSPGALLSTDRCITLIVIKQSHWSRNNKKNRDNTAQQIFLVFPWLHESNLTNFGLTKTNMREREFLLALISVYKIGGSILF